MRNSWIRFLMLSFGLCLMSETATCQEKLFKFKVAVEGVYRISGEHAQQLGLGSLSEVALFGYPGMLPQRLDSINLTLQEVPGLEKDGSLYFYLTAPHITTAEADYSHHRFSDSLSFLIGRSESPQRMRSIRAEGVGQEAAVLYSWSWLKEEENNILTSGRKWYSRPLSPGMTRGYPYPLSSNLDASWKLKGVLMAQSLDQAEMAVSVDGLQIFNGMIAPIPSGQYGIKGREIVAEATFVPPQRKTERLRLSFSSSQANALGFLDYLGIGIPHASIGLEEGVYQAVEKSRIPIRVNPGLVVLEASDFHAVRKVDLSSGTLVSGQKFVVFNPATARAIPKVQECNPSLRHQASWPELLIIAPPSLSHSAERLRIHKLSQGVYAEVALLPDIYDSFGYGNTDLHAIRNFLAWHYQYGKRLENALLLGKGTIDYKSKLGGRPNLVPIYTSRNSLDPLTTFSSDDFFALLDWGQGVWEENKEGDEPMRIGVGRLPVINPHEARLVVDKIIAYETSPKPGNWKRKVSFFADDGDNNIHLRDAEAHAAYLSEHHGEFVQQKLYLDRYEQVSNGNIQSSPEAKLALAKTLEEGTLLLNYIGHGNETTLTAEEVFRVSDIQDWPDQEQLALWITATCEFGRHDSPFIRSAAEELLIAPNKGAIGLFTTGRPVFSSVNYILNQAFIEEVFKSGHNTSQDLGTIFKNTKNGSLNGPLNRNFSLLGDPSMHLSRAPLSIRFTGYTSGQQSLDTLPDLTEITFDAEVLDPKTGGVAEDFTGFYELEFSDVPSTERTLGQESNPVEFSEEQTLLFKGRGKIDGGKLSGKFLLPKNTKVDLRKGKVRITGLESTSSLEAFGYDTPLLGESRGAELPRDTQGPVIRASFGGKPEGPWVFPSRQIRLEAMLSDESGIAVSGLTRGQNLMVEINGGAPIILNDFFIAQNGNYQEGTLEVDLKNLREGTNSVKLSVWDNVGNLSILEKEIQIAGSTILQIISHRTFPNPTELESHFVVEHNRPGENIRVTLSVYLNTGQILFEESQRFVGAQAKIDDLSWIFLQNQTKYPAKGTYIYNLTLHSETDNSRAAVSGKIVIK